MVQADDPTVLQPEEEGAGFFQTPRVRELLTQALTRADRWMKRKRSLGSVAGLVFVLLMVLHRDKSMPWIMDLMASAPSGLDEDMPVKSVTNEALLRRRKYLGSDTLRHLFELTAAQEDGSEVVFGRKAYAIDSTRIILPDTPENEKRFGRCKATRGRSAFPQLMVVVLLEVTTRRMIGATIQRCDEPELRPAWSLVRQLRPGSVLFLDRGFASGAFLEFCMRQGVHVVVRMKTLTKPKFLRELGTGDSLVRLTSRAPKWEAKWKPRPVDVRYLTYRVEGGEVIRLATTLVDPAEAPALAVARSYSLRWEIEIAFKELKVGLIKQKKGVAQTHVRSRLPDLVLQEVYAALSLYNLLRGFISEAARSGRKINPHDIGFVATVERFATSWPDLLTAATQERVLPLVEEFLQELRAFKNKRPRRARRCTRMVKQRTGRVPVKTSEYRETKVELPLRVEFADTLERPAA